MCLYKNTGGFTFRASLSPLRIANCELFAFEIMALRLSLKRQSAVLAGCARVSPQRFFSSTRAAANLADSVKQSIKVRARRLHSYFLVYPSVNSLPNDNQFKEHLRHGSMLILSFLFSIAARCSPAQSRPGRRFCERRPGQRLCAVHGRHVCSASAGVCPGRGLVAVGYREPKVPRLHGGHCRDGAGTQRSRVCGYNCAAGWFGSERKKSC